MGAEHGTDSDRFTYPTGEILQFELGSSIKAFALWVKVRSVFCRCCDSGRAGDNEDIQCKLEVGNNSSKHVPRQEKHK
jgi:hypothetical protein